MPLAYDSDGTQIFGTIGVRDSPSTKWRYGSFVPARVLLHARSHGGTLLTVLFEGEKENVTGYLPSGEGLPRICGPVGDRYASVGIDATGATRRVCAIKFSAAQPRDAFLARAADPHARPSAPPAKRPRAVVERPELDDLEGWRALYLEKRLIDLRKQDLQDFCMQYPQHDGLEDDEGVKHFYAKRPTMVKHPEWIIIVILILQQEYCC